MAGLSLVPVDYDPFGSDPAATPAYSLVPVDHDPFAAPSANDLAAQARRMLATQSLRDPATFDPRTYAPAARPQAFATDPMDQTYGMAGPAVGRVIGSMAQGAYEGLIKNPIDAAYDSAAHTRGLVPMSDSYQDPSVPAATDAALWVVGGGVPAAEEGALGAAGGKLVGKLTKPQEKAIRDYTGGHAISANTLLRQGEDTFNREYSYMGKPYRGQVQKTIDNLDRLAAPLGEDTTLYRSMPVTAGTKPGEIISDAGFGSTSRTMGNPKAIADSRGEQLVEIRAPKGSPAIDTAGISQAENGEVILPRGYQLHVDEVGPDRIKATVVHPSDISDTAAVQGANAARDAAGIRAYHGSPHDFERFDLSKIGTGEGAQAYGHGLYFAEQEATAQAYKKALSGAAADMTNPEHVAGLYYHGMSDRQAAIDALRDNAKSFSKGDQSSPEVLHKAADLLESGVTPKTIGKMYEVNINADPEHFLDWDKPLSEQSDYIREKLGRVFNPSLTGRDAYQSLVRDRPGVGGMTGAGIKLGATPTAASGRMNATGVPGIKYLDQGSRAIPAQVEHLKTQVAGLEDMLAKTPQTDPKYANIQKALEGRRAELAAAQPTHNYVVFDDKLIDILRKYGLAGLIPGMGAVKGGMSLIPVDHDPFAEPAT